MLFVQRVGCNSIWVICVMYVCITVYMYVSLTVCLFTWFAYLHGE